MIKPLSGCGLVVLLLLALQRAEGADRMIAAEVQAERQSQNIPFPYTAGSYFF